MENNILLKYITLKPTNACNLNCDYCFAKNKNNDIFTRYDDLLTFLKHVPLAKKVNTNLSGGEPTLVIDNIYKIYTVIKKLNRELNTEFTFGIFTNGTHLDKVLELLNNDILDPVNSNISWDGIDYKNVRINNTNIDINKQLKILGNSKYGNEILVRTAISKQNISNLYKSVLYLVSIGCTKWEYYYLMDNPDYINKEFLEEFKKQLILISSIKNLNFYNLKKFLIEYNKNEYGKKRILCGHLGKSINISTIGNVYPCGMCSDDYYKSDKIFKVDLLEYDKFIPMYNSFIEYLSKTIKDDKCKICKNIQCSECCYTIHLRSTYPKEDQQCLMRDIEYEVFKKYI